MNSAKPAVAEDATALAEILGLTPVDGAENPASERLE